jgi:TRAP-type C4-dicarboxylate transport system permease small subunit
MRRVLNGLYGGALYASALLLIFIAVTILSQVGGRLVGIIVPSADELAGYSMAAATFLALADVLRAGQHIRVHMVIEKAPSRVRRLLEMWSLGFTGLTIAYFAWFSGDMALSAFNFGEMSPGLLAIPLWIPQSAMTGGLFLMALACFEGLFDILTGRPIHDPASGKLGSE